MCRRKQIGKIQGNTGNIRSISLQDGGEDQRGDKKINGGANKNYR